MKSTLSVKSTNSSLYCVANENQVLKHFTDMGRSDQGRSKPFQPPRQDPFSAPPHGLNLKEVFAYDDVILFKPVAALCDDSIAEASDTRRPIASLVT